MSTRLSVIPFMFHINPHTAPPSMRVDRVNVAVVVVVGIVVVVVVYRAGGARDGADRS